MTRIHRLLLIASVALAAAGAIVVPAPAATDGTSNTLMSVRSCPPPRLIGITAIEFKNPSFMDYTDDACLART
jgi:hypothetical protein